MVKKRFLHPLEIEVHYVLPAIKRNLAIFMKEKGMKQKEIAKILQINDATVSQYIKKKRGSQVEFGKDILAEIKKSAGKVNDKISLLREIQHILLKVRRTNTLCRIHKKFSEVPSICNSKTIGCV